MSIFFFFSPRPRQFAASSGPAAKGVHGKHRRRGSEPGSSRSALRVMSGPSPGLGAGVSHRRCGARPRPPRGPPAPAPAPGPRARCPPRASSSRPLRPVSMLGCLCFPPSTFGRAGDGIDCCFVARTGFFSSAGARSSNVWRTSRECATRRRCRGSRGWKLVVCEALSKSACLMLDSITVSTALRRTV